MKRLILLFLVLIGISSVSAIYHQEQLIRYEFEECSGDITLDLSNNDNNGLLVGAKFKDDRQRFGDCSIEFKDDTDYLVSLSTGVTRAEMSLSLWWNRQDYNGRGSLVTIQDEDVNEHYHLKYNRDNGNTEFHYRATDNLLYTIVLDTTPVSKNQWQHSVLTLNFNTSNIKYYEQRKRKRE